MAKKGGNPQNLKPPFPKGVSGNPKGRPALPDLSDLIQEEIGDKGMREAVQALLKAAKKGNVKAIQELLDRGYGKVKQPIDHTNNGEAFNLQDLIGFKDA